MLRDRYTPQDLFSLVPTVGLAFDPVPAQLDTGPAPSVWTTYR